MTSINNNMLKTIKDFYEENILKFQDIREECTIKLMCVDTYPEKNEIIVCDSTCYGAVLRFKIGNDFINLCTEGKRFLAKCKLTSDPSKEKVILDFVSEEEGEVSKDEEFEGPPTVGVILKNSQNLQSKILVLRGANTGKFIRFKYYLEKCWENFNEDDFDEFETNLPCYRTGELESIASMYFCHHHECPLQKISVSEYKESVIALRLSELATSELNKRYDSNSREPHVKIDLPSGKYDYNIHSKRLENAMETALRELEEEAGISASNLEYLGRQDMVTTSSGNFGKLRRKVFFFQPLKNQKLSILLEKSYIGSSWTDVEHIKASLKSYYSESSFFLSIGRFCECIYLDAFLEALIFKEDNLPDDIEMATFEEIQMKQSKEVQEELCKLQKKIKYLQTEDMQEELMRSLKKSIIYINGGLKKLANEKFRRQNGLKKDLKTINSTPLGTKCASNNDAVVSNNLKQPRDKNNNYNSRSREKW